MRNALRALVGVASIAAAAYLGWRVYEGFGAGRAPALPPRPPPLALPADFAARLDAAGDLEAAELLRDMEARHAGSAVAPELAELRRRRCEKARAFLAAETERLEASFRFESAASLADRYRRAYGDPAMEARLEELRERQAALVAEAERRADAFLEAGRIEAAREAFWSGWELEEPHRRALAEAADRIEERIARRGRPTSGERPDAPAGGPARPTGAPSAEPGPPPPLPVGPHPDVKRLKEARELFRRARELHAAGKYEPATRAAKDLLGFYPDLPFVQSRREGIDALFDLCRHGATGVAGLLHATESRRVGDRWILRYTFAAAEEMRDWEELPTIAHGDSGRFEKAREGVLGTGVRTFLLRAFFQTDATIRARATPQRIRTHGLAFCQAGDETRQLMLLATNHWFVEGENYVKERPGHSLIMIGKGTNNDVPLDAPEMGFIFRVTRDSPVVSPGDEVLLSFTVKGYQMSGEVECRERSSQLRGEARGDDGRGIERVRPALFVVQNSVVFRDVAIDGQLHPAFEKERVAELLDLVESMR